MTQPNATSGDEPVTAPGIHDEPPDKTGMYAFDMLSGKVRAAGPAIVKIILAQVLYAIAGISIFGVEPFAGLRAWADDLQQQANDAYNAAGNAQTSANYANYQITGMLTTDVPGGVAVSYGFEGSAATNLGASFTQVYTGAGGGTWGLGGDGSTIWNASGGISRKCVARHNTPTTTDYQRVRIVFTSVPQPPNFGGKPSNYVCGRMNSACTSYVYCKFTFDNLSVGYCAGGSETNFTTIGFTLNVGDTIDFYIGTDTDERQFIVKRNGVTVVSYTDSADASAMGSSNWYVGLGCEAADKNFYTGQQLPGKVNAWAGVDRQPTTI